MALVLPSREQVRLGYPVAISRPSRWPWYFEERCVRTRLAERRDLTAVAMALVQHGEIVVRIRLSRTSRSHGRRDGLGTPTAAPAENLCRKRRDLTAVAMALVPTRPHRVERLR